MSETQPVKQPVCAVHVASRGPRFYRGADGVIQFKITLDARSSIGPRAMTEADKHQYPTAWKDFQDEEVAEALDAEAREAKRAEAERRALERISVTADPDVKAAHEAAAAERQAAMDKKRRGGL